ncbi:BRO-N domain-containing protein [Photobacterium lipolyticum]|uniref:BRO-N domain-containing protein n=1 Tax=Photobacterium lipolyticum TaxID=266810 RepID=UPI002481C5AF|nr:BRO family protein [Photobacterium lipolyticum]
MKVVTHHNDIIREWQVIPESDVYRLVMRSQLPAAVEFQDWVCEVVLPSIRQNGGYIANQENDDPELILAKALQVAQRVIDSNQAKLAAANKSSSKPHQKLILPIVSPVQIKAH